ncbi:MULTISPECIES: lipopolysaccharide assembly LapA domain-containing protein [unclassified Snodgrassella]|uniref:LapA family protein n=1 Tax=unclassified Snodgrassella TaxID=2625236 RepID=UPI0018DCD1EC|nr:MULTISPECIES: LapA family protein [unclassified Snodgrassella]MBI0067466.1 LapA family protein [Snodgrassella sp. M0110]MBI0076569.1 LapA family protein [Snodgrassella sp. M0118]MBI0078767.1 LapA family protein [Snodgrassella sp. M0112]
MKIIYALIKIAVLLILLLLAVSNTQMIAFNYLPGQIVNLPLIVLLMIFFIIGAVFGVFAMFGRLLRLRSQVNQLQAKLDKQIKAAAQAVRTENLAVTATQPQSDNSDQKKVNN